MKKNPDFKLRIPISCEVEYKGFKALVMVIPANNSNNKSSNTNNNNSNNVQVENDSNIVFGPTASGEYKYNLLIV